MKSRDDFSSVNIIWFLDLAGSVLQLVAQPIQSLVQTISRSCPSALNVPVCSFCFWGCEAQACLWSRLRSWRWASPACWWLSAAQPRAARPPPICSSTHPWPRQYALHCFCPWMFWKNNSLSITIHSYILSYNFFSGYHIRFYKEKRIKLNLCIPRLFPPIFPLFEMLKKICYKSPNLNRWRPTLIGFTALLSFSMNDDKMCVPFGANVFFDNSRTFSSGSVIILIIKLWLKNDSLGNLEILNFFKFFKF